MAVDYSMIFAYGIGIVLLYFFGRLFVTPIKLILKVVYNILLGAVAILIINLIGGLLDYRIDFNAASAAIVGFLGVPGVILLIFLKNIYKI